MLLIHDVLEKECNIQVDQDTPRLISSPLRSDSSPSFRVFPPELDDNGKLVCNGAYDYGKGKAYTCYSFIKEYHGFETKREVLDHIKETYGITMDVSFEESKKDKDLLDKIIIIANSEFINNNKRVKALEKSIVTYYRGNTSTMDTIIERSLQI